MEPKDIAGVIVDGQAVYYRPGEVIAIGAAAAGFVRDKLKELYPHNSDRHAPAATLRRRHSREEEWEERVALEVEIERARGALADLEEALESVRATHAEPTNNEALEQALERARATLAEPNGSEALEEALELVRQALADPVDNEALDAARQRAHEAIESARAVGPPLVSSLPPAFRFVGLDDATAVAEVASSRGLRVQLNHVFFSHCGCGCDPCCEGNPYGAFPYKATPYKATPYKATPYKATAPTRTSAEKTDAPDLGLNEARELAATLRLAESVGPQNATAALPNINVWILDTGTAVVPTPLAGVVQRHAADLMQGDQQDHPNQWPEAPEEGDDLVDPVAGHGTFIAGIIAELAPGSRIWISRLIRPTGDLDEWDVATEIHRLVENPPPGHEDISRTILNLSFGGGLASGCSPLVGEAIVAAQEAGIAVVASAGNDASCVPVYPGNFPGVIAVGALDSEGIPASFTNRGSWVDACALGVDIVSTFFDTSNGLGLENLEPDFNGWAVWSGTSFAAPVVVAAIAQEMSTDPKMSAVAARRIVLDRGTLVPCLGVSVIPTGSERLLEGGRAQSNSNGS